jgi:AraC-like DNA-binding protein
VTQVHSVAIEPQPAPCESCLARPDPRLRGYVAGYAGFRSGAGAAVPHRLLPLNLVTLIVDVRSADGIVTGARDVASVAPGARWGHGVAVGLTPAGAEAVLGVPMAELAGVSAPLQEVAGRRAAELIERLAAAPDWSSRFAVLDRHLATDLPGGGPDAGDVVARAWWRLQQGAGAPRVGALAGDLGVSRRHLEQGFRRRIGLPPGTVARVARFQRAVGLLSRSHPLPRVAAEAGYADQPHLTRDVHAMSGLTPRRLCAFLQYGPLEGN